MAIINSIVMGKSKGKIGNVVTTTLKGQVIAKSRNFAPANPKTVLQTNSRGKMSNAVLAWQFLSLFLAATAAMAKSTESTYNAFIRLTKNFFSEIVAETRPLAAAMLSAQSWGIADIANVSSLAVIEDLLTCTFETQGAPWRNTLVIHLLGFDPDNGNSVSEIKAIPENSWNLGTIDGSEDYTDKVGLMAYIVDTATKKTSNVYCG